MIEVKWSLFSEIKLLHDFDIAWFSECLLFLSHNLIFWLDVSFFHVGYYTYLYEWPDFSSTPRGSNKINTISWTTCSKCIFAKIMFVFWSKISLKFVRKGMIDNKSAFDQAMA